MERRAKRGFSSPSFFAVNRITLNQSHAILPNAATEAGKSRSGVNYVPLHHSVYVIGRERKDLKPFSSDFKARE